MLKIIPKETQSFILSSIFKNNMYPKQQEWTNQSGIQMQTIKQSQSKYLMFLITDAVLFSIIMISKIKALKLSVWAQ